MKSPLPLTEIINDVKDVMEMYDEEEVAFVVRAVGAHVELVEALKEITLYPMTKNGKARKIFDGFEIERIKNIARAALKKVEARP